MTYKTLLKPVMRIDLSDTWGPRRHADAMFAYCRDVVGCNITQSDFNPRYVVGKEEFLITFPQLPDIVSIPKRNNPRFGPEGEVNMLEYQLRKLAVIAMTYTPEELIADKYKAIWPVVSSDLTNPEAPFSQLVLPVFQGLNNVDFRIGSAGLQLVDKHDVKRENGVPVPVDEVIDGEIFREQVVGAFVGEGEGVNSLEVDLYRRRAVEHFIAIVEASGGEDYKCYPVEVSDEVDRGLFYDRRIYTYVRHDYEDKPDHPLYTRIEYRYRRLKVNTSHLRAIYNSFC